MLSIKLYDKHPRVGGTMMADWSLEAEGLQIETEQRGFGAATFTVPMPRPDARRWFGRLGAAHIQINDSGTVIYEGRVETAATLDGPPSALSITALGYWRAFSDVLLNTTWSSIDRSQWAPVETAQLSDRQPADWSMATEDRLLITASSGGAFDLSRIGSLSYTVGSTVSKVIQTLDASYSVTAPTGWTALLQSYSVGWAFGANLWSVNGNGATQTGTITVAGIANGRLVLSLYRSRSATTLGTAIAAGSRTVTPGSIAGIAVGNKLWIGGTDPEEVEVTAVVGATFTAVFRYAHLAADVVSFISEHKDGDIKVELTDVRIKATNSSTVTASEVITTILTDINASNPSQISASAALVGNPAVDLKEYTYDTYPSEVIDQLTSMGDASGNAWAARVWDGQILRFGRVDQQGAVYQIRQSPELARDLDGLRTHIVPRYTDGNGNTAQGTTQANLLAVSRYNVRRNAFYDAAEVDTAVTANSLAATALLDTITPEAQGDIVVTELFRNGQRVPLWMLRAGDIVECVEFPSSGNQALDSTRRWRVGRTLYDHDGQTLTISPPEPASTIEALLARQDVGGAALR